MYLIQLQMHMEWKLGGGLCSLSTMFYNGVFYKTSDKESSEIIEDDRQDVTSSRRSTDNRARRCAVYDLGTAIWD
jgi:hypothetical protein